MTPSEVIFYNSLEGQFLTRIRTHGAPEPKRQHMFHPTRKWRFDYCWPSKMIAAEVLGGQYQRRKGPGGHNRGAQMELDAIKYNAASALGWRVFFFTTNMVHREIGMEELASTILAAPLFAGAE